MSNLEIKQEQWKYIYSVFPFIDLPFAILSIIYSQHWIATLCMAPLFPIVGSTILKLSEKRDFQPGPYIFLINGSIYIVFAYIAGHESPSWLMLINIAIGCSFLFNNVKLGRVLFGFNVIFVSALFYWMGATLTYSIIILSSCFAILILFSRTYDYMQFQQSKIEAKNKEIKSKTEEIIDSINYAKRIQRGILPSYKSIDTYLKNSFIIYLPKDIVAGDFYWLEHINGITLFAAADCTGHRVPGAMVSVICHNALNRSVREHKLINPGEILDKTREIVVHEFEKSDEEVNDGMDISLCSIEKNTLCFAGAHNPLWIVRNGKLLETKADKQPIGKFDNPSPFTTHKIDLVSGDMIYIFTDGYADQFGGEKGKKLKSKAFKELLSSIYNKPLPEQQQIIEETFRNWMGELEQVDDVCIIGLQV